MIKAIQIENLYFGYDKKTEVLHYVSLDIIKGSITAILGRNGCGKSTLLDCIIGYNPIKKGCIKIDNIKIDDLGQSELARKISYISQNTAINIDYKVLDFILFGRNCFLKLGKGPSENDYEIVKDNAKKCNITHLLNKEVNKLSGGEKQLVLIARALTQESPIIIMDEPSSSLDFCNQAILFSMIKQLQVDGKTVVFTTHNPNHLLNMNCNLVLMKSGKILEAGTAMKLLNKKTLEKVYDRSINDSGKNKCFSFNV